MSIPPEYGPRDLVWYAREARRIILEARATHGDTLGGRTPLSIVVSAMPDWPAGLTYRAIVAAGICPDSLGYVTGHEASILGTCGEPT